MKKIDEKFITLKNGEHVLMVRVYLKEVCVKGNKKSVKVFSHVVQQIQLGVT